MVNQDKTYPHLWIMVDDAQISLFNRISERFLSAPAPLAELLNTSRAFRVYFMVFSQGPRALSEDVLRNSAKLLMMLPDHRDFEYVARSMGLTREQMQFCHQWLTTGKGILKLRSDRWPHPIPITIPDFPIPNDVTDEEVAERLKDFQLPFEPRLDILDNFINLKQEKPDAIKLTHDEEAFLVRAYRHLEDFLTLHYKYLDLSADKGTRITRKLIKLGFIRTVLIHTGKRGQWKIVDILSKGRDYLNDNLKLKVKPRKESAIHEYAKLIIGNYHLKRECEVVIEGKIGHNIFDVIAIDPSGQTTGIEVVCTEARGKTDLIANKIDQAAAVVDKLILVTPDDKLLKILTIKLQNFYETQGGQIPSHVQLDVLKHYIE
ncbi:hypothetical protein BVY01_05265 [bacterium I07]|nr:hypothetical protein BVY01_05265 [bacterium I07]